MEQLTTARIREILNQHRDKMTVQLDPPDNAKSFWDSLFNDFEHVIYDDESKKWGKNYDKWSQTYSLNSYPADVSALNQYAYYFTREGFPLQNGQSWAGDDLSLVNKSGRLLKRFNKFVKLATGHDLDNATQGKLGDKLQYFVNAAKTFVIDFHDAIDWRDGMYGHSGSCWFPGGCYEESSEVFDDNGGWSIRFYRDMDDTYGTGRTWIVPMDNGIVAFNCYGPSRAEVSKIIKKVFAGHDVELHYKSVSVYNSQDDNIPYVNSGTGFVLAESGHDFLESERVDLDWEVSGRGRYSCDHCGDRVNEDDYYSGPSGDGTYCESCYNDLFSCCEKCNETFNNDDVYRVSGSRYDWLCEYCLERIGAVKCEDCGDYSVDDYNIMQDSENVYCESCADRNTEFTCQCGERFEYAMDDGDKCESCDYVYCDKCNEMVSDHDDHDSDVHPGDDSEISGPEFGTEEQAAIMFAEESEVTLCREGKLSTYTLKVYRLASVPGLFVYDEHTLDKSSDHKYHVMHQCGLAAKANVPQLEKAIAIMQGLGTLTDWDKSQDEILAEISAGLGSKASEIIRTMMA
jgi:formylmethanofuran dehydrogenase subunit E